MIYLNRVKLKKQLHSFLRKSIKIEVGLAGNRPLERVESGLDESEAFEVSKGSWSTNKEHRNGFGLYTLTNSL